MTAAPQNAATFRERTATRPSRADAWALALLALVVWIDQSTLPMGVALEGPDGSFQTAMEQFFHRRARAGVDWVFTYGPLGLIHNFTYDPALFAWRLVLVDVLLKGLCAWLLVRALWRSSGPVARVLPVLLIVLLPLANDAYLLLVLLAAGELVLDAPASRARALALALAVVPLSLSKFTFFIVGVPLLALAAWAMWRQVGRSAALRFLGWCIGGWLALWIALGQSPLDIPIFLARSLRMAAAYGDTMNTEAPPDIDALALALLATTAVAGLLPLARRQAPDRGVRALMRVFVLFVAFKAGLVRGFDHADTFFFFALVAVFLFTPDGAHAVWRGLAWQGLRAVAVALGCLGLTAQFAAGTPVVSTLAAQAGIQVDSWWRLLTRTAEARQSLDAQLAEARASRALPRCRAAVADEGVDIQPPFQDSVLWNDFRWQPRPVFQPYATLDGELQQLNASFLESDAAPRWFLLHPPAAIDGRLETMEDAAALQVLARDWRPVVLEDDFLLLRRDPAARPSPRRELVLERDLPFGESIDVVGLPGGVHLLELEVRPTWLGRLRQILLRPAEIHGRFTTAEGREYEARLVPRMLEHGAIVDPVLNDVPGWLRWYAGNPERLRSLILLPPKPAWAVRATARVRLVSLALTAPAADEAVARLSFPMFETMPYAWRESGPGETEREGDELVRVLYAPARLRFRLPRGRTRVSGAFGLLASTYELGESDGILLQGQVAEGGGRLRTVFRRYIDPRRRPEERGVLPFEFEVETERPAALLLRVRPGPQQDDRDDRAFLTRVRLE